MCIMLPFGFALKQAFSHVHAFFFFFYLIIFFLQVNSNLTWVYCSSLFMHCSHIKNGSHDTIYIFKNYFATVFSVFSNNKFNPNTPNIYIYIYIYYKHAALNKENLEEHTQKKKTLERNKVLLDNHGWVHH